MQCTVKDGVFHWLVDGTGGPRLVPCAGRPTKKPQLALAGFSGSRRAAARAREDVVGWGKALIEVSCDSVVAPMDV
jgi:hypothetical protein